MIPKIVPQRLYAVVTVWTVMVHLMQASPGPHVRAVDVEVFCSRSTMAVWSNAEQILDVTSNGTDIDERSTAGLYLLVLNQHSGSVIMNRRFQTSIYAEGLALYPIIKSLSNGRIIIFAVKPDAALNLARVTRRLLASIGLFSASWLTYRSHLAWVLVKGGPTLAESVAQDDYAYDLGTYSAPMWLQVTVPLADPATCQWMSGPEQTRKAFCSSFDGYGEFCACDSPTPIRSEEFQLQGSVIEDVPTLVIAGGRPTELYRCLLTLLEQAGGSRERTVVVVDGEHEEVEGLLQLLQVRYNIHLDGLYKNKLSAKDFPSEKYYFRHLGTRISKHYNYAIGLIFDLFPEAPAVIILEEDLLASPDFYSFFNQTAWLLDADPSLYCISAWNDHGAMHTSRDVTALLRVETLTGIGWMLSRKIYDGIRMKWRRLNYDSDWDIWLRSDINAAQRECVVPEVPRVFHFGLTGAHVKGALTMAHFAGHLTTARPDILLRGVDKMLQTAYEKDIYDRLTADTTVFLNTTLSPCSSEFLPKNFTTGVVVLFFQMTFRPDIGAWQKIAACLGLWHLDSRGHHRGMFRFKFYNTSVMAIGYPFSDYSYLMPPYVSVIEGITNPDDLKLLSTIATHNRIRLRVPDLEPYAPSLMIETGKKQRTYAPIYVGVAD